MARGDEFLTYQLDTVNNGLKNTKRPNLFRSYSKLNVSSDLSFQPNQKQSVDLHQSQNTHQPHNNHGQIGTEKVYQFLPGGHAVLR